MEQLDKVYVKIIKALVEVVKEASVPSGFDESEVSNAIYDDLIMYADLDDDSIDFFAKTMNWYPPKRAKPPVRSFFGALIPSDVDDDDEYHDGCRDVGGWQGGI